MRSFSSTSRLALSASTLALIATLGTPAFAQTQTTPTTTTSTQTTVDDQSNPPAQTTPPATQQNAQNTQGSSIVVTGTRIKRPEFTNPNPTQTFDSQTLQNAGATNLADFLTDLPALQGSLTNQYVSGSNLSSAQAVGINLLNLRNLGTNRTLVLVNGRRHIAGFPGSASVDINTIPTDLVDRIDVETGGTSAVYGSDGVSGVVNFIMKRDFSGLSVRGQYSLSQRNDAGNAFISATYGKNFADGRGNIAVSYEYNKIDRFSQRERLNWGMTGPSWRFVRNPADFHCGDADCTFRIDDPNIVDNIPLTDLRWADSSPGGAIDVDFDFAPDFTGEGTPYDPGTYVSGSPFTIGGSSTPQDSYFGDYILGGQHHIANLFGHFDVSDQLKFFVEGTYVRAKGATFAQPTFDFADLISDDNAYLLQRFGSAAPFGAFIIGRDNFDFGIRRYSTVRDTWRGVVGAEGDLSKHLRYELSLNYGQVKSTGTNQGDRITDRYFAAMDAVVNPANGQITCRINLPGETEIQVPFTLTANYKGGAPTTFQPGQCVPINLFGSGSPSQEALNWILATHTDRAKITQTVLNGYVSGDTGAFFNLPGGPVGFAAGAEYRRESSLDVPSAYSQMTVPTINDAGDPINVGALIDSSLSSVAKGHFDVKEAFAEVNLPILSKVPFAETLSIGAAGRVSDYSTVGTQTTWSVNGIYAPVRDISFRGTLSRAVRAPNVNELFAGLSGTFEFITDPCGIDQLTSGTQYRQANCATLLTGLGIDPTTFDPTNDPFSPENASIQGSTGGNPTLRAEAARTWTAGVVLRPRFIPGLNLAFDWYHIRIKDAINTPSSQELAELCVDQPTLDNIYCQGVTRSTSTGYVSTFLVLPQNVAQFKTAGLDMALNYRFAPFRNFGSFNLNVKGNYLKTLQFVPTPGADVDEDVTEPFSPKWSATGDLTWTSNNKRLVLNYGINWYSRTRRAPIELTDANPDLYAPQYKWYKEYWEHEVQASYDVTKKVNMYFGIRNLLDTKPDVGAAGYPISAVGRSFYVGVRLKPF
jgi:outer membrane receptor protein involved in Fe transport